MARGKREKAGNVGYVLIQRQKECWGNERGRHGRQKRAVVTVGENCYGGGTKGLVLGSQRPGFEHQLHLSPAACACGQVTQPLRDSVSITCKMEQVKPSF